MNRDNQNSPDPYAHKAVQDEADVSQSSSGQERQDQWLVSPSDFEYFTESINPIADTGWMSQQDSREVRAQESLVAGNGTMLQTSAPVSDALTDRKLQTEPGADREMINHSPCSDDPSNSQPISERERDPQFELFEVVTETVANGVNQTEPHKEKDQASSRPYVLSSREKKDPHWLHGEQPIDIKNPFLETTSYTSATKGLDKNHEELEAQIVDYFLRPTESPRVL